jgi:hypothetical protein
MKIDDKSFERLEQFTCFRTALTNQSPVHEEIASRPEIRQCLLSIGAESFAVQFATQKYKHQAIGKVPRNRPEGPDGGRLIALLFLDFGAREEVGGQYHAPAALPPGKTRYPLYRRLDEPQGWSERNIKTYRTIILPVVYGCETWSVTLTLSAPN